MSVIATRGQIVSNWLKATDSENTALFFDLITVNEATQTTYKTGTVLGKITASGKYIVSKQAAADGSQNPVAIVVGDGSLGSPEDFVVPATTDTKVLALVRGKAVVSSAGILLDASFDLDAEKAAAYASLKTVGILVETGL